MTWHTIPKDDAWKQVTLAYVVGRGKRIWVHCACGRNEMRDPTEFAAEKGLALTTPLLAIALRLRCQSCGKKQVQVWPDPTAPKMGLGD